MNRVEGLPTGPRNARERLNRLMADVGPQAADADLRAVADDPQQMANRISARMRETVPRIHASIAENVGLRNQGVWNALLLQPDATGALPTAVLLPADQDLVREMVDGLTIQLPATPQQMLVNPPEIEARYLHSRVNTAPDGTNFGVYGVNVHQLQADRKQIQRILSYPNLTPEMRTGANLILERLNHLEQSDITALVAGRISTQLAGSVTSEGMGKMGRLAIIVGGGAAALLGTLIGIQTGNFSGATVLYAAGALAAAYPGMFRGNEEATLRDVNIVLRSPAYVALQRTLSGADLMTLITALEDSDVRGDIERIAKLNPAGVSDDAWNTVLQRLLPGPQREAGRKALLAAIRQDPGTLRNLARVVASHGRGDDSQKMIADAARIGSTRTDLIGQAQRELAGGVTPPVA